MTEPVFPPDQTPIEPYIKTEHQPKIELVNYFNDPVAKKIGHIRKVLESIALHIGSYYKKSILSSFANMDMADVEVYLPLMQSVKIESSRYKMTSIILANAMRTREFALRPGVMRSSYQLPAVFTAFVTAQNAKASDIPFLYEMFATLPMVLRHYDGTQLGVMRVNVNNSQMSRNPMSMEAFDAVIQFNLNINGIIDYSVGRDAEVIFSIGQSDLFGEIKRQMVSDGFSRGFMGPASVGAAASGAGLGDIGGGASVTVSTGKNSAGQSIQMIDMESGKNLFRSSETSEVEVSIGTIYAGITYSSPDIENGDSGITISDFSLSGSFNKPKLLESKYASVAPVVTVSKFDNAIASKTTDNLSKSLVLASNGRQVAVTSDPSASRYFGTQQGSHLILETIFAPSLGGSFGELVTVGRRDNITSASRGNSSISFSIAYIINLDGKGDSSTGDTPGHTRILVYGNDGKVKNIARFLYTDKE